MHSVGTKQDLNIYIYFFFHFLLGTRAQPSGGIQHRRQHIRLCEKNDCFTLPASRKGRKMIQSPPTTSDHRGLENLFPPYQQLGACTWKPSEPTMTQTVAQRPQQTSERKSFVASLSTNSAPTRGSSTCLPLNQTRVQQKAEKTSTYVLAKVSEDCTLSSVVLMVSLLQPLNSAVLPMGSSTLCNSHEIA